MRIPIFQKNNSSIYSDLFVQNAGDVDIKVDLQFIASTGSSPTCNDYRNLTVKAGAALKIPASDLTAANSCDVGATFVGSVQVSNSENQPLAIASTQYKDSGGVSQLYETSNTQLPATTLYAPLIQNNNNGNVAGLTLSRTGAGDFTVRYYRGDTGANCTNQLALTNNPQIIYPAPPGALCPTLLAAKFEAGSPMAANVNQLKTSGYAATYAAIATPSKVAIVTKVRKDSGWNDAFVIANFNSVAANVTVNLYNADGTFNSTIINSQAVAVNAHLIVLGQIPAGFNGSAVVTADQPVAVSVNSLQSGAGDALGSYPANHR